jgi:hypothetical protein
LVDTVAFKSVTQSSDVVGVTYFSQEQFRQQAGIKLRLGLCSPLIQVWWQRLREGKDALTEYLRPHPELVQDVLARRITSHYVADSINLNSGKESSALIHWLQLKYEISSLSELASLCLQHSAKTPLELDLMLHHNALIAATGEFFRCSPAMVARFAETGIGQLHLMILRYGSRGEASGELGHRFGLARDASGIFRFFDPNCGEALFSHADRFAAWFPEFWEAIGYSRLAKIRPAKGPRFRLYLLAPR